MNTLHHNSMRFRWAFSLMELVVVMSIITILVGIMAPPMYHFIKYVKNLGN